MFGRNVKDKEGCEDCDEYSHGRADAKESIIEELKESFPLTAPFNTDAFEYAKNYIQEIRDWATKNLGVAEFQLGKPKQKNRKRYYCTKNETHCNIKNCHYKFITQYAFNCYKKYCLWREKLDFNL